jgi:hypothetical protein
MALQPRRQIAELLHLDCIARRVVGVVLHLLHTTIAEPISARAAGDDRLARGSVPLDCGQGGEAKWRSLYGTLHQTTIP